MFEKYREVSFCLLPRGRREGIFFEVSTTGYGCLMWRLRGLEIHCSIVCSYQLRLFISVGALGNHSLLDLYTGSTGLCEADSWSVQEKTMRLFWDGRQSSYK